METPEFIRAAYAPAENETPEQRRRRLASMRAAKYRYFGRADGQRREQGRDRQRRWREMLDGDKLDAIREQNRLRQAARRGKMTAEDKIRRNQQQRQRRAGMDDQTLQRLREREKLRMRRRRDQQQQLQSQSDDGSSSCTDEPRQQPAAPSARLSSPLMQGRFGSTTSGAALPPAAALGANGPPIRSDDFPPPIAAMRQQHQHHHHPPIEIAPLQFVLPPASSIQSLTFADRTLAPLPLVQNVLPHASTLLNAAAPPLPQLLPLSASLGSSSANTVSSATSAAPLPPVSSGNSPFVYAPPPSSSSSLGALLNPPGLSLPPHLTPQHPNAHSQLAVLPSLSQLPDLLATSSSGGGGRDFFDSTSATSYFPSIADFTSEFETTFRT